jgi:hypothetical protein
MTCPKCMVEMQHTELPAEMNVCPRCKMIAWEQDGRTHYRKPERMTPLKATADRSSGVLTIVCPGCRFVHEFADASEIDSFICVGCGDVVDVVEPPR